MGTGLPAEHHRTRTHDAGYKSQIKFVVEISGTAGRTMKPGKENIHQNTIDADKCLLSCHHGEFVDGINDE